LQMLGLIGVKCTIQQAILFEISMLQSKIVMAN
jgi:hypothetical protein